MDQKILTLAAARVGMTSIHVLAVFFRSGDSLVKSLERGHKAKKEK